MLAQAMPPSTRPRPDVRPRASAKDVARLAGVSTATVSRAINSPEEVDAATRRRVETAIRQLGYVPHGAARALRSRRSKMIGAVVPSFDYALYARTTSALQTVLDQRGYALVLATHYYDLATEVRVTGELITHGVDAFAFVGLDHDPRLYALLEDYGRPYVLTWGVDPSGMHPSIGFDNRAATYAMTRHLIELGHQRFALISASTAGNDRARERGAGVRAALSAHGLALPPANVQYGSISLASAAQCMERILALRARPTAVIATNDVFAVGAMMKCRERGVQIPRDLSVTGVDNTDLGATQTPPLTSISTPIVEVGSRAALQLIARLEGEEVELQQTLPFELVKRGTTASPSAPEDRANKRRHSAVA
jgi:LacI family transcriptional regulator